MTPSLNRAAADRLHALLTLAPAPERRAAIASADVGESDPVFGRESVRAETGYLDLPVVRLPHRVLVYRVDNGRLLAEVAAMAAARGVGVDALSEAADRLETQSALHALLVEKARDPRGPVFAELAAYARQTAPLLIRRDGLVVNGNRRLSAMRALLAEEPDRFGGFETVAATLLPEGISEAEIEFIEASLQMAPDLKLDYGWANRRLKLRAHARDLPPDRIVDAYRFRDAGAIARELDELALAEAYLDYLGAPKAYARLEGDEPLVEAMAARLAGLSAPALRAPWQAVGFAMLAVRDQLDQPIEHYFPFAEPKPPLIPVWTLRRLAEDAGLVEPLVGEDGVPPALADRLAAHLGAPARAEAVARAIVSQIDALKADDGRLLGAARAIRRLRQARESLESLDPASVDAAGARRIRAEIASIQSLGAEGFGPTAAGASAASAPRRGWLGALATGLERRIGRRG